MSMDAIVVEGEYYIRASAQNVVHQRVSIKHGDSFVVTDRRGDLPAQPDVETGFYVGGTRHLSTLELRAEQEKPVLLSSSLADDDAVLHVVQTNHDVGDAEGHGPRLPKDSVLFERDVTVQDGRLHQRLVIRSYHLQQITMKVEVRLGADFIDIFEVRGYQRERKGEVFPPLAERDRLTFLYRGLDQIMRRTIVRLAPEPQRIDAGCAAWTVTLAPHQTATIEIAVAGGIAEAVSDPATDTARAVAAVRREQASWERGATRFFTANDKLNVLLERASADLRIMATKMPEGFVPYAGIPWYCCPFGRDALWTSLMALPLQPKLAAGTLRYLAKRQAEEDDPFVDAEPGKILHEMRTGEMANLREIPFIPYYGSIDATPLFVVLLDRYVAWTGDSDLLGQLWDNAKAALTWVRKHGDLDGDGFLEYWKRSPVGLHNQGWKDSSDSVFHRDGEIAVGPIALVEAQAYAWAALKSGERLARLEGEASFAEQLAGEAETLRVKFESSFWSDARQTYAIALDGKKRPCEVITSNPGHALWAGIVSEERAAKVVDSLLSPAMFSGWGVRTVAEGEPRFNPISYHNGSVWPHDNAILAAGAKRYGHREAAARIASAILDAAQLFDDHRVPELFCGFARQPRHEPTPYTVACRPQAWSAATIFALVGALLGLAVDGVGERVLLDRPSLPAWLEWIEVTNLSVGSKKAMLRLTRGARGSASVVRADGAKVTLSK